MQNKDLKDSDSKQNFIKKQQKSIKCRNNVYPLKTPVFLLFFLNLKWGSEGFKLHSLVNVNIQNKSNKVWTNSGQKGPATM